MSVLNRYILFRTEMVRRTLLMFKGCLANGIVPFIITDELKLFYYRGLREGTCKFLTDTCLSCSGSVQSLLDYFKIKY